MRFFGTPCIFCKKLFFSVCFLLNSHSLFPGSVPQPSPDPSRASLRELSNLLPRVNRPSVPGRGGRGQLPVQIQLASQPHHNQHKCSRGRKQAWKPARIVDKDGKQPVRCLYFGGKTSLSQIKSRSLIRVWS